MAIRKEPGGITPHGDDQNSRIKGISNVSKTVNQMQRQIDVELKDTESYINSNKSIKEVQSSMNNVLKKLGDTVGALSEGVKTITITTAQATKDAVAQYGRAVGQDINWNKQNFMAMTLARATPIFGYFAAKFMETDVFKKAAVRMREQVGKAFSSIGGLFRRQGKRSGGGDSEIPHMARGGYVKKGGLAKLHPAEVVMPIDEILSRLDENMSTTKQLAIVARKAQLQTLGNMKTFVGGSEEKAKVGVAKGFLRAYSEVNSEYLEPDSKRQLRALLAIQDSLGAQISQWRQIWQKMLIEHPVFRNLMFLGKNLAAVGLSPFKLLRSGVKDRGGYKRIVSNNKNPMVSTAQTLANYTMESLFRLDNIVHYTKLTAEASRDHSAHITKKKYPAEKGIKAGTWSILGGARKAFNFAARWAPAALMGGAGALAGPQSALAGWKKGSSWGRTLTKDLGPGIPKWMRSHAYQREMELEKGLGGVGKDNKSVKSRADEFMEKHLPKFVRKGGQFYEQKVASEKSDKRAKRKTARNIESQTEAVNEMNRRQKRKGIFGMLAMAAGFIKTMLTEVFGNLLSPITSLFKGGFFKTLATGTAGSIATALAPVAAVLVAALIGAGLGVLLNKYIFSPLREKWFNDIDKKKDKTSAARGKVNKEIETLQTKMRAGKATPEEIKRQKRLAGHQTLLSNKLQTLRKKRLGDGVGQNLGLYQAVTDAQISYFADNYDKYDLYSEEERARMRLLWLQKGGGGPIDVDADPMEVGRKREELFLKFLKINGSIRYAEMHEPTAGYKAKLKYGEYKGKAQAGLTQGMSMAQVGLTQGIGMARGMYGEVEAGTGKYSGARGFTTSKYGEYSGIARDKAGLVWNSTKGLYEQVEAGTGNYSALAEERVGLVWNKTKGMYERVKANPRGTAEELKERVVDTAQMIKTEGAQEISKRLAQSEDLKKDLKDLYGATAEGFKEQSAAFTSISNNFVNNVSNAVSNSAPQIRKRAGELQEEITNKILHGRMH